MQVREEILKVLKKRNKKYISGQELSEKLSLSRTAIWKHIEVLRGQGYKIDASPRQGYRLLAVPDLLFPAEIRPRLKTRIIGKDIIHYHRISSTNDELKRIALGKSEGTVAIAEIQEGGRGRLNRKWYSPRGGLWFSVLLKPSVIPRHAPKITLAASVAIVQAIDKVLGLKAGIKWPNDIMIGKRKVGGILTEMAAQMDRIDYVILGIGVNANINVKDFPSNLKKSSTSLKEEKGNKINRLELLVRMLEILEEKYLQFQKGNFSQLLKEWRKFDILQGRKIKVQIREKVVRGIAQGIDEEGNLTVRTQSGIEHVIAGDVIFS